MSRALYTSQHMVMCVLPLLHAGAKPNATSSVVSGSKLHDKGLWVVARLMTPLLSLPCSRCPGGCPALWVIPHPATLKGAQPLSWAVARPLSLAMAPLLPRPLED